MSLLTKKKRPPLQVNIVNPEAIPIARERLTVGLLELRDKQLMREAEEKARLEAIKV